MTDKPGAIIQNAEQDRGPPLAARGEHLPRAVVTIPVPQAIDVRGLVAAYLAVEQSRFGALGACGLARCHPTALVETVRLHEAAQGVVAGQRLQIVSRLGERDEIVVMKLNAPVLVRGILRQHDLAHRGAHRGLLAGIGAQLAAQDADRVAALLQGAVEPALDGGEAEARRFARDGVTPLAPGKRFDLGAQLALGRRRRQQLSNYGEAQMRPPLMDSGTSGLLCHAGAPLDQGARTVDGGLDCWRRASSADREKPLASAPVASGDRGEEAQQRKEPLAAAAVKALDQRDRQAIMIDGRHEGGPADLPERARREGVAPPLSPALDRPAVDADQLGQLSHPRGGRAFPHDRDQHDYRGEIDLAPEKPERRRRSACAATVAGAAEAEAPIMLLAEPGRTATRLAAILGRMQNAAAQRASFLPRRNRDVLIKDEKQLMECGVCQQG